MMLLTRNTVSEFVPGCDYTAVRLDEALASLIGRRVIATQAVRLADDSIAELRYWDAGVQCVGTPDPETAESIEDALDSGDGWALLDDDALGAFEPTKADCTHMVILSGESPSVAWSYRVGSEPVRTVNVSLADLAARLGSPLGDPLRDLP